MIKQQARVTQVFDQEVELECALNSTCSGCSNESNCGVGTVAKAFSGKTQLIRVNTSLILHPGQWVTIATVESSLLMQSFITYLFPLFGLLGAGIFGQWFLVEKLGFPDLSALLCAILGGYISFLLAKKAISRLDSDASDIQIIAVDY